MSRQSATSSSDDITADFQSLSVSRGEGHLVTPEISTASTGSQSSGPGSPPETPGSGDFAGGLQPRFCLGEDLASSPPEDTFAASGPVNSRKRDKNNRFRRILNPIRRSQSAGCTKDVSGAPAATQVGALKQEVERVNSEPPNSKDGSPVSMSEAASASQVEETASKKTSRRKNLAKDVRQKFSWLRRRHTETALPAKDTTTPQSSTGSYGSGNVSAMSWSIDIERLLNDKEGVEMFREFLESEFSEENLEFWIACEGYKSLKPAQYKEAAAQIYKEYVAIMAPREVNLDSKTRAQTHDNLRNPDVHCFDSAQKRITTLMAKDSYRRFLDSEAYQELVNGNT